MQLGLAYGNIVFLESSRRVFHFCLALNPQTEVVQSRRIGVVRICRPGWPKHITKVTVVILNVFLAANLKLVLSEAKDCHYCIIKLLGPFDVQDGYIDVIDSDDFWHVCF